MKFIILLFYTLTSLSAAYARSFYVEGAGGVPLAVTEVGPVDAPGILFIHGIGFARDSFRAQFDSSLANKYHLVAFDLRGHGMSGKPWTASDYTDPAVWAQDVTNVMAATKLTRPIVVAWSYGTLVVADALRVNGSAGIGGLVLVSALGGLVEAPPSRNEPPRDLIEARKLQKVPELDSQREASRLVSQYLTAGNVPDWWPGSTIANNLMVPPFAQPLIRQHPAKNVDLLSGLHVPLLIIFGGLDSSISPKSVELLQESVPMSEAILYEKSGHSPFAEESARFNSDLAAFVDRLDSAR